VRASRSANIREEHLLRQRVQGYRDTCNANLSLLGSERRRLSANLIQLRKKLATPKYDQIAEGKDKKITNDRPVTSEEMFLKSKGYFPDYVVQRKVNGFPPLKFCR